MALLDDVAAVCERLAEGGWDGLLSRHGLDLGAADLRSELLRPLPEIDRTVPGFEDFAGEGTRAIEPGAPARSLLYHALATPHVGAPGDGEPLAVLPTLADIEAVENFVYGVSPPSLDELVRRAGDGLLAVGVFAYQYRPGQATVHRRHADLCFSRTGVARVGTAPASYDGRVRGFVPLADDRHAFRVLPSQFSAWVAVQRRGDAAGFGPLDPVAGDQARNFWVPLHKLFDGDECLAGLDLQVTLLANHRNEKLRRVHMELTRTGFNAGWAEPDIGAPPFAFSDGIAEWSDDPSHGAGVLMPVVHPALVEPASFRGQPLSFRVPPNPRNNFAPSLFIPPDGGARHAPEYVHVRQEVTEEGVEVDLNDDPEVARRARSGRYRARHYVDFTGDGWVTASVPALAADLPRTVPAYSIVTAPDFYPDISQRELLEWWAQRVPTAVRDGIWAVPPVALSGHRFPPNLQLPGSGFRPKDETVSAIVGPFAPAAQPRPLPTRPVRRHTHLPDAAAGVFAPGWDTSRDRVTVSGQRVEHLAAYGLGSPFPEDAKLCAALSAFWPAVAPDAARSFSATQPTVTPMTDAEIGSIGDLPWDGVPGPSLVTEGDRTLVEYASFDHVDYVQQAIAGRFSLALTAKVGVRNYQARMLAMARAYLAADRAHGTNEGLGEARARWDVLSFRAVAGDDAEVLEAQKDSDTELAGQVYRVELFQPGPAGEHPTDHRKQRVAVRSRVEVLAGARPAALVRSDGAGWRPFNTF